MSDDRTEIEKAVEEQRIADIEDAQTRLTGKELNDRIVEINRRVAQWKIDHPELVKDPIPF